MPIFSLLSHDVLLSPKSFQNLDCIAVTTGFNSASMSANRFSLAAMASLHLALRRKSNSAWVLAFSFWQHDSERFERRFFLLQ